MDREIEVRMIDCEYCEGTGDHHAHEPDFYDPYYVHRYYGRPCHHCDGTGSVEVEVEPVEEEELCARVLMPSAS